MAGCPAISNVDLCLFSFPIRLPFPPAKIIAATDFFRELLLPEMDSFELSIN
jgi:hypothetical protein